MNTTLICAQCRAEFRPVRKPGSIINRPGTSLRAFCPTCSASNEAAWRRRRDATVTPVDRVCYEDAVAMGQRGSLQNYLASWGVK